MGYIIMLLVFWTMFSFFFSVAFILTEKQKISEFNVYKFVGLLPGMIILLPFCIIYQMAKFIFSLQFVQKIHHFLNTPVGELFNFSIKIERK
jgi:cellobiose-specific phosphotransferase system component IIC